MSHWLTCRPAPHLNSMMSAPRRYAHRSPSYAYMKMWREKGIDYSSEMNNQNMGNSPKLISQILRTEAAMNAKGLASFIHAAPAAFKVLSALNETLFTPRQFLRNPKDPAIMSLSDQRKRIPEKQERIPRSEFLCASYALTCNTRYLESAASWGFANHGGSREYFSILEHVDSIKRWKENEGKRIPSSLIERIQNLVRGYLSLEVGEFFVLGVPKKKLSDWIYDSHPFYVPTGKDVRDVVENPRENTIAVFLLAKEVLSPSSELVIVSANDTKQVDQYGSDVDLDPPELLGLYDPLLKKVKDPDFETREWEDRVELDRRLDLLVSDLLDWDASGKEPLAREEKNPRFFSYPEVLI